MVAEVRVAGETLRLLPDAAVHWPARATLLIADPHFGKDDRFRREGLALPRGPTVTDLQRLTRLVGALPSWSVLQGFLPDTILDPLERRAALASTLVAGLEMARGGGIEIRQEEAFGPIHVRRRPEEGGADDRTG